MNTGQLIKTISQTLHDGNSTVDQDIDISMLMADGWQIIDVTVNVYKDTSGDWEVRHITRFITLVKHTPVKS